jgi:glucokinase
MMSWTAVGIDIGGTKMLGVRVTDGAVVERLKCETPDRPDALSKAAAGVAESLWSDDVSGLGVGVAGLVAWPQGEFVWGPHVAGTHVPLRDDLVDRFRLPVVVDNDANMAAWGELHLGRGHGYRTMALVTLGTGIGGALVIDGHIYRGRSFAGEWGHMRFEPGGALCHCGKQGCWETSASGPALVRLAQEMMALNPSGTFAHKFKGHDLTGEQVTAAAEAGDETARSIVARVGAALGQGLCTLIAIVDPEIIVVGGGLGSVGEVLLEPARRVTQDALHGGSFRSAPPIVTAALGPEANAIGAALMAHHVTIGEVSL